MSVVRGGPKFQAKSGAYSDISPVLRKILLQKRSNTAELFAAFDVKGDGLISKPELATALSAFGVRRVRLETTHRLLRPT